MQFEWDEEKAQRNLAKHGVPLDKAYELDWERALSLVDTRFEYGEERILVYAPISDRLFVLVYTRRGDRRRVISLRKANRREVVRYERAKEAEDAEQARKRGD